MLLKPKFNFKCFNWGAISPNPVANLYLVIKCKNILIIKLKIKEIENYSAHCASANLDPKAKNSKKERCDKCLKEAAISAIYYAPTADPNSSKLTWRLQIFVKCAMAYAIAVLSSIDIALNPEKFNMKSVSFFIIWLVTRVNSATDLISKGTYCCPPLYKFSKTPALSFT